MKYILLLVVGVMGVFASFSQVPIAQKHDKSMALRNNEIDSIKWFDVRAAPFSLIGFEWIDRDSVFRRLPLHPDWKITEAVHQLADHTAGGQIRFQTSSNSIYIKVALLEKSGMYHMAATGQSGFDLYVKEKGNQRFVKTTRFPHDTLRYQQEFKLGKTNQMQAVTLNFPLYNGVKSVSIGIEENALVKSPQSFTFPGKFVIYGTSITQGGCVSRPGMAYSNILSRKLDAQFVNLGFSGNGKGEPELAHIINQISEKSFIILDYEANANKTIQNTIGKFVQILREKHLKIPILIMSKIRYTSAIDGSEVFEQLISNRDFQKNLVAKRQKNGDNNIYFLDGTTVLGEDYHECTVDGSHPTDLGSYRIAKALLIKINQVLNP